MTFLNRPELPPEGKRETSAGTPPASALQGRGALAGTKPKTCTQQDGPAPRTRTRHTHRDKDTHQMSTNKITRKTVAGFGALAVSGALLAAACSSTDGEAVAIGSYTPTVEPAATYEAPVGSWGAGATTDERPKPLGEPAGPFTTGSGVWFVPADIEPGTYRAYSTRDTGWNAGTGYYAVCADAACEIDFDGSDYTGLIDNGNLAGGPGLVVVPEHAAVVELSGVRLEAIR